MLSTFATFLDFVDRVSKVAKRYVGRIQLVIPTVIKIYNKLMGGTDGMDQQLTYYKPRVKSRRWPVRVFLQFLQVSAYNSFVLYRQDKAPKMKFLQYIEMLLSQMAVPCIKRAGRKVSPEKAAKIARDESRYTGIHEPFQYRRNDGGEVVDYRRRCRICHTKVSTGCFNCDVALCLKSSKKSSSCFKEYHEKSDA